MTTPETQTTQKQYVYRGLIVDAKPADYAALTALKQRFFENGMSEACETVDEIIFHLHELARVEQDPTYVAQSYRTAEEIELAEDVATHLEHFGRPL